ncbi:MAG: hypothetical protein AB8B38_06700 [Prochlorococcus sp.]
MSQHLIDQYLITVVHFVIGIPLLIAIMRSRSSAVIDEPALTLPHEVKESLEVSGDMGVELSPVNN